MVRTAAVEPVAGLLPQERPGDESCSCHRGAACSGSFCPGPRLYMNGFEVDSSADDEERSRVEAAGPELMVRALSHQNPWLQGLPDALDLLRAADRLTSWVAARQAALIAQVYHQVNGYEVSRTGQDRSGMSFTLAAQEIAPLLRVPGRTAHRMLGEALRLSEDLPATWEALDAGKISPAQAQVIVEESGAIPAESTAAFEDQVLETAGALTRPKLAQDCRRLRETLHPESIIERRSRASIGRNVTVQPEQDGMAWLSAYLPAEQAHGIFNRVDVAARSLQGPEEPRTLAQLRADVFSDVLTHTCSGDPKKGTGFRGIGANVFVTVPVMSLLGHRTEDWKRASRGAAGRLVGGVPEMEGCSNGFLDGYGPIDPQLARSLAAHAPSFTRILVHPETGAVLSVGRDRYRPPKHLRDWVRITHPTCVHPGCNRSSWSSEIDHGVPWAHGGKTELSNLRPRCKLHHMLKSEGFWPVEDVPPGEPQRITSLAGKSYTTLPGPPPPF